MGYRLSLKPAMGRYEVITVECEGIMDILQLLLVFELVQDPRETLEQVLKDPPEDTQN